MTPSAERAETATLRPPSRWRFLLIAIFVPALLAAMVLWLRAEYNRSEEMRLQVVRSYDRRIDQLVLLSRLKDVETAQRGFLLTGDPRFLSPYEPARRAIRTQLAAAAASEIETGYIARVSALANRKIEELDRSLALYRGGKADQAVAMVVSGRGRLLMDTLRVEIGRMIAAEEARSNRERARFIERRSRVQRATYVAAAITIVLLLGSLVLLWRFRRDRYASLVAAIESGERHAIILDSTIDAILILNPSGTIETVNAAATRMLGYTAGELERRDIATVLDLAPGEGSFHQRVGLQGTTLRRSFLPDRVVHRRDGHPVSVDVAIGVMQVPSGLHLVVSLRDIAERKRVERMKDELISTVSHELRTPLTSVVGALALLRAGFVGTLPADGARLVDIAESNSRRLIRLINDMLDIDRIESGKLVLEQVPFDLRAVVERACLGSEGLARAAEVRFECTPGDRPQVVSGDADRLLQVATNLLSNAIRAAPVGSSIEVGIEEKDGAAVVTVADRGGGVPAEFRQRMFGRFERAAGQEESVGTGLGLAISREIVERHGGAIWFEDRDGGGTRFLFSIPLAATAKVQRQETPAPIAGDGPRPLILHVDDDRDLLDVVAAGLARDAQLVSATGLTEARTVLRTTPPDLAILDIRLASGSGLDLLPFLVGTDGRRIPAIIYTAQDVSPDQARAVDAVLVKTRGTVAELRNAIHRLLSRSEPE